MNESAVKEVVTKGLYGLIALTVSGVLAFSVYVVRDLRGDIEHLHSEHKVFVQRVQDVHELVIINTGRIGRLEQDIVKVGGSTWKYKQFSPRGEWE